MSLRRPPGSESTERNSPSVEAAFQAVPPEMVAELLGGELHVRPRPARPHTHVASILGGILTFRLEGRQWVLVDSFVGEESIRAEPFEAIELELALVWPR